MPRIKRRRKSYADNTRPFFKRVAGPVCAVLVLFYLCFHAVSGERGVVAMVKETRKLALIKAELAEVIAKREALDAKVQRLSSNSLDLDLLDERARQVLGLAGRNEVVYFLNAHGR